MIAESKLDNAMSAIGRGQEDIKVDQQAEWAKKKADLIMEKDGAEIAKADVEAKLVTASRKLANHLILR